MRLFVEGHRRIRSWYFVCALPWIALTGCTGNGTLGGDDPIDGNADSDATSVVGKTSGEPNDTFSEAVVAVFTSDSVAQLQGTVSRRGDLDVYLLEGLEPGDRVVVETSTPGSALDDSIALFDDQRRLISTIDDVCDGPEESCLDARMDVIVRRSSSASYLVVTQSSFAVAGTTSGSYTVEVSVTRGNPVPAPQEQTLVLEFDGANVDSPVLGTLSLSPFDAGDIDFRYEGETETLRAKIIEVMRENYEGVRVTIVDARDFIPVEGVPASVVFFGGFNPMAFGIAESVDLYNAERCDDAIIFSESFGGRGVFSRVPSVSQLGIAIGNVASHEAGHLLGLNHVSDDLDLMDDVSPADAFLLDQEFKVSNLSEGIIPIGTQDGALLLRETVGPR